MSRAVKFIKNNAFLAVVTLCYLVLTALNPSISLLGIKNSGYYIKEMLMIMPVIFVLTALLDTWVPKHTILNFLGKDAKTKGVLCAFIIGSISAGPIYAAFPFCVMLHKKGASIRNIVIILSSWAVVKIPMLLNEAKFLGMQFMAVRWVLTVVAILIFSWICAKIAKDEDLPQQAQAEKTGVIINKNACMGCTVCSKKYPQLFGMAGKKAVVKQMVDMDMQKLQDTIASCPVNAIDYN